MTGRRNAYLFLAFPLTVLFIFTLAPTVLGLGLSLFSWAGSGAPRFVGLENFRALLGDPRFTPALRNTLVFVIATVPPTVLIGFLLAVAVHAKWFVGKTLVRTALFLPTVVSIVAIGFVWRWMLDAQGGMLPIVLRGVGIDPPDFLQGGPVVSFFPWLEWPMLSVIAVQVWRTIGFCMVLYLAALQGINESLYEAAEVDGAGRWHAMRHITWPQVAPMTVFLLVTGVIGALQVFDIIWAMTNGTETNATVVLNLYVFREFQQSRLGYAAAIGVVIFALTVVATAGQLALVRRRAG
ncbi:MAG: sugar ABC transporter permease [Phycisphaerales bacterium]|nr:sugar ABC transporter permease [Phycisphaerales bacterium]